MGTFENWQPPVLINDSIGLRNNISFNASNSTSFTSNITLTSDYYDREGVYMVILSSNLEGYGQQTAKVWFNTRSYKLVVNPIDPETNVYDSATGTDDNNVTIKVTAFGLGSGVSLNNVLITSVEKEGEWGVTFMDGDNVSQSCSCSGTYCNLTFNVSSDFRSGNYILKLKANNSNSEKSSARYFFSVQTLSITVPEMIRWWYMYSSDYYTNATSVKIDGACGTASDEVIEPNENVSNCKYRAVKLLNSKNDERMDDYDYTVYIILDKSNNSIYVNLSGRNFTNQTPLNVGDSFSDGLNEWRIDSIDSVSNYVYLELINGVLAGYEGHDGKEYYPLNLDTSISKSGKFLHLTIFDDEFMEIDLDGDGNYSDRYTMLLADSETAGVYDTVLVSNETNSTSSWKQLTVRDTDGLEFGGSPIYLMNIKYMAGSGTSGNSYNVLFTSNSAGWPGEFLGIYSPGSIVKIPVKITKASNTSDALEDRIVSVDKLYKFGTDGLTEYDVTANATPSNTSDSGVAIVLLNTTGIPNGDYFVEIVVNDSIGTGLTEITTGSMWENPMISIRSFEVRGDFGMASLPNLPLYEISEDENNLAKIISDDYIPGFTDDFLTDMGNGWRVGNWWPFDNIYFNGTNISVDPTRDDDLSDNNTYGNSVLIGILSEYNNTIWMNVTGTLSGEYNTTINVSVGDCYAVIDRFYKFVVNRTSGSSDSVNITITKYFPWESQSEEFGGGVEENDSLEPWASKFNVTVINSSHVVLRWDFDALTFDSPYMNMDDVQSLPKIGRTFNRSGYSIIIYNDVDVNVSDDLSEEHYEGYLDTVILVNNTNGQYVERYNVGEQIPELDNWYVVDAHYWDNRVYLSNFTVNNNVIYPLPWVCDNNYKFYVLNTTENEAGVRFKEPSYYGQPLNDNITYYMLFYDGVCDGSQDISSYMYDDDTVFDTIAIRDVEGEDEIDYDYYTLELGYPEEENDVYDQSSTESNFTEEFGEIGGYGMFFTVNHIDVNNNNETFFSYQDGLMMADSDEENYIDLWVSAFNFNGTPINGNISVLSVDLFGFDPQTFMRTHVLVTDRFADASANINNGEGYLTLNFTNSTYGEYLFRFNVTDSSTGNMETLERMIFVQPPGTGGGDGDY
jgi:hypothetical protein